MQKTITIPVPELPPHIAKEWEIVDCRPPKKGDHYMSGRSEVALAKQDHPDYWMAYILRRKEPEWEVPECLKMTCFSELRFDGRDWMLCFPGKNSRFILSILFPTIKPPTDTSKVYTW